MGNNTKKIGFIEIKKQLDEINLLLRRKNSQPLNAVQAADYLSISLQHLYRLTSQRKIPFYKPANRYIYFFTDELNEWITGDCKTQDHKTKDEKEEEEEPP